MDDKRWTIRDKVEYFLKHSDRARNDDKYLILLYWKYADKLDFNNFVPEFLEKSTPQSSIVRARALIQADSKYLPNDIVAEHRKQKEQAFRHIIHNYGEVPAEYDNCDEEYYND